MSILISDVRLPFPFTEEEALTAARRKLRLSAESVADSCLHKQSLDLRHGELKAICSVELWLNLDEAQFVQKRNDPHVKLRSAPVLPKPEGKKQLSAPPVIIGFGPAGIFAALVLAKNGYRPVVLERGSAMKERDQAVSGFFSGGALSETSNIQFGEGGAGAYSDGKLTTRIGDNRCELVLKLLAENGAPREALCVAKPHIGTDLLKNIVVSMRREVEHLGGTVRFSSKVERLIMDSGRLRGLHLADGDLACDAAVLAIGHSARDSFRSLLEQGLHIEPKPFSVGVRAEHLQEDINRALYGKHLGLPGLPVGEYAVSYREGERGCYSFCMCPGGEVVAAASEAGGLVTNGMSYHARAGKNANAALCVSVTPEDFGRGPLDGAVFQRKLEQNAFQLTGGTYEAPVQLWGDFAEHRVSTKLGRVTPTYPRGWQFRSLDEALPPFVCEMLRRSMPQFAKKLHGFDSADTVFTGIETRTSSPVRILRGQDLNSTAVSGLIPCGEGAGYAGGIMSAAVDGIRAAEAIMREYRPLD